MRCPSPSEGLAQLDGPVDLPVFMDGQQILIAGVGGLGCAWARSTHIRCPTTRLLVVDADDRSLRIGAEGHVLRLGNAMEAEGCAALPALAEQRMRTIDQMAAPILRDAELVVLLAGLGGGAGSGAAAELARQARRAGSIVIAIASMPFEEDQPHRASIARAGLAALERCADVTVRVSLPRLAHRARERGEDWSMGSEWIEDLVDGLVHSLLRMSLINLDLMDLRSILKDGGAATLLVGSGPSDDVHGLIASAASAPLADVNVEGATGCYIHLEGGRDLAIGQMEAIADAFTRRLSRDAKVILGARISDEMHGQARVIMLLSGLRPM